MFLSFISLFLYKGLVGFSPYFVRYSYGPKRLHFYMYLSYFDSSCSLLIFLYILLSLALSYSSARLT